jgi:hypothetical protein
MTIMHKTALFLLAVAATVAIAACSKSPDAGAKQTRLELKDHDAGRDLHASGRPEAPFIDPQKKNVVVLAAPSAPQLLARQEAKVGAEREKVETKIHGLMDGYASNLGNPNGKEKYQQQIAEQLQTYKRQSLELFLMQRQAAQVAPATP